MCGNPDPDVSPGSGCDSQSNMNLILDTETTGVTPTARIVSLSWALYDDAEVEVASAHHVIFPDGFTIPPEAAAVHGITTADARRTGIPIGEALTGLAQDITRHAPALFIGHNVAFDRPRVLREFSLLRMAENLSRLPTYCTMQNTVQVCRIPRYNGGYKWPKLEELHVHLFGRGLTQAHDARADVLACARCFFELRRRGLVASR